MNFEQIKGSMPPSAYDSKSQGGHGAISNRVIPTTLAACSGALRGWSAMDTVDTSLVAALRANGRASYAELGRLVGLSGPSVQERVRRLEDRGVITGYRATVEPSALGLGLTALIGLVLSDSAGHEEVGARLEDVAEVEDCWFIAGDEAYMLKVRVADVEGLERLLGRLVRIEGVARTRTTLVISTRFEDRQVEPELVGS